MKPKIHKHKFAKLLARNFLGNWCPEKEYFFTACIPSSPFSRSNIKCDYSNVSHYLNINSLGALHADKHVYSIGWHTCLLGEPTSKSKWYNCWAKYQSQDSKLDLLKGFLPITKPRSYRWKPKAKTWGGTCLDLVPTWFVSSILP